jgi:hypothetical protein
VDPEEAEKEFRANEHENIETRLAKLSRIRTLKETQMTTELKKIEIANQFLSGLRTRDWDLLKSVMANDLVWNLPGSSLISGEAQGVDAVIQRAQLIVSYGLTFSLKHILIGRHGVALSLNNTARRGGPGTRRTPGDGYEYP